MTYNGGWSNICCFVCLFISWLVKHPGFEFDLQPRDSSCLPKEYKNAEGTCYFLDGYSHNGVVTDAGLNEHIDAAMAAITAGTN